MLIVQEYKIIHPLISPGAHLGLFMSNSNKNNTLKGLRYGCRPGVPWLEGKYVPKRTAGEGAGYMKEGMF